MPPGRPLQTLSESSDLAALRFAPALAHLHLRRPRPVFSGGRASSRRRKNAKTVNNRTAEAGPAVPSHSQGHIDRPGIVLPISAATACQPSPPPYSQTRGLQTGWEGLSSARFGYSQTLRGCGQKQVLCTKVLCWD